MSSFEIFKYSAVNKNFIDSIVKEYIYFAKPSSLNDPFDCKINIPESISRAIAATTGKAKSNLETLKDNGSFLKLIEETISETGICSFSGDLLKPVLWSHYADEHRGVCCTYDIPPEYMDFNVNKIIGLSDVNYGENILTEELINIADDLSSMDNAKIFEKIVIPIFSSKGSDWSYEEELRIVRGFAGPLKLNKEHLKQICFGLHTSDSDKELIYNIIKKSGYSPSFCEIIKSDTDFGLKANDL